MSADVNFIDRFTVQYYIT